MIENSNLESDNEILIFCFEAFKMIRKQCQNPQAEEERIKNY